jgi:hypothetical protein
MVGSRHEELLLACVCCRVHPRRRHPFWMLLAELAAANKLEQLWGTEVCAGRLIGRCWLLVARWCRAARVPPTCLAVGVRTSAGGTHTARLHVTGHVACCALAMQCFSRGEGEA